MSLRIRVAVIVRGELGVGALQDTGGREHRSVRADYCRFPLYINLKCLQNLKLTLLVSSVIQDILLHPKIYFSPGVLKKLITHCAIDKLIGFHSFNSQN